MDESCVLDENDTLPDGAWKDSFDKLLDDRPYVPQGYFKSVTFCNYFVLKPIEFLER